MLDGIGVADRYAGPVLVWGMGECVVGRRLVGGVVGTGVEDDVGGEGEGVFEVGVGAAHRHEPADQR